MSALTELKKHLRRGQVYRRADLLPWSNAVDRHLKQLVEEGTLTKLAGGLYYFPEITRFGLAAATAEKKVKAFLKGHRFLLTSLNDYNVLRVGTTQLYNHAVVYNHKRHGWFTLGNLMYDFRIKPHFPLKLSEEFLLVDLVDNIDRLMEDGPRILEGAKRKALRIDQKALDRTVQNYGGAKAKKFFASVLTERSAG